tara:strand:- start:1234 stop:1497 length:264 start_codon:yes stop_codon:yes gene_type:complete
MFKLLSELNINDKKYKNLALLPGFNINESNNINETFTLLNKTTGGNDILDEKVFIKLITVVDEGKKKFSKKRRKVNLKKSKVSRKKK